MSSREQQLEAENAELKRAQKTLLDERTTAREQLQVARARIEELEHQLAAAAGAPKPPPAATTVPPKIPTQT